MQCIKNQSNVVYRISLYHKIKGILQSTSKVVDSSEIYCLSDFGGYHSNLKMFTEFNIHNNNINKKYQVLYIIRNIFLALKLH